KFVFAAVANPAVLGWITSLFGQTGYRIIGSFYIGSLTGIFEIGITLFFAVFIKKMYAHASRAIGIGLGAGIIEALLIAFSQIGNMVFLMVQAQGGAEVIGSLVRTMSLNPLFFMLAPVERSIAILCHTSSRVLTLYAVMRRKYIYFWAGFLIMTGIDAIAGYAHLAGLIERISMWWIELALLPFALASIPIIQWCSRHWQEHKEGSYGQSDIVK
ncbi:YhfC family intramembrane metalloprotease, partial [candidate division WOR-3 bacterium]|nr:YhfC family intramembrane metalloprotease [candidate division WOR-3 bacterium]